MFIFEAEQIRKVTIHLHVIDRRKKRRISYFEPAISSKIIPLRYPAIRSPITALLMNSLVFEPVCRIAYSPSSPGLSCRDFVSAYFAHK